MTDIYRVEPDGTRVYRSGNRYKPKPVSERKIGVRKPDDPRAVRFNGTWLLPLPLLDDAERPPVPLTRPDSVAYDHMAPGTFCGPCGPCRRPEAERWRRRWRREHGLRS